MDPEQIREEMKLRRASIDHKLDELASHTRDARQRAIERVLPVALTVIGATAAGVLALKRRARKPRRSFQIARKAAAFR